MIHEEVSGKIIGAAMKVLNELKPGLDEKLYERALIIELERSAHVVSVQRSFPVSYRGEPIGNLIPDLIVDNAVIVDPKVVACFTETHIAQMIGYHRLGFSTSYQFQKCAVGMETRVAFASARGKTPT
jgi:GxxExxY protein